MEPMIDAVVFLSSLLVPMLAIWAVAALYTQGAENNCYATEILYFGTLLLVSFVTLRTVATNDCCWLIHTATLGIMIVAGVMRRPAGLNPQIDTAFNS